MRRHKSTGIGDEFRNNLVEIRFRVFSSLAPCFYFSAVQPYLFEFSLASREVEELSGTYFAFALNPLCCFITGNKNRVVFRAGVSFRCQQCGGLSRS